MATAGNVVMLTYVTCLLPKLINFNVELFKVTTIVDSAHTLNTKDSSHIQIQPGDETQQATFQRVTSLHA